MVEWLALFVSLLVLLAIQDLGVVWRRLRVILAAAILSLILLIVALLAETYVLPFTNQINFVPDWMKWPFLAVLFFVALAFRLWEFFQKRRQAKRQGSNTTTTSYLVGWLGR